MELEAGGLDSDGRGAVLQHLRQREVDELTFLDYLAYMPLWMGIHTSIVTNPLHTQFASRPASA